MSQQNKNLISFRVNDAALVLIERNARELNQSMNTYCQEIIYRAHDIKNPELLTKEGFKELVNELVDIQLTDMQRQIDELKEQVTILQKPKSTARKPKVNTITDEQRS